MSKFDLIVNLPNKKKQIIKNIKIPLIGIHNIRNSVAAAAVALTVGITTNDIKNGLLRFNGVQRRFNKIFSFNGVDFYDDYAHHYLAGEKIKLGLSYLKFAKEIIKNSKVRLFLIKDNIQLAKFIKKNIYGKKIVIGMGAGTISNWMRELPELMK